MGNQILEYAEERGMQLGEERNKEEVARKMVAKGYDTLDILELTGISPENLRRILKKEAV